MSETELELLSERIAARFVDVVLPGIIEALGFEPNEALIEELFDAFHDHTYAAHPKERA